MRSYAFLRVSRYSTLHAIRAMPVNRLVGKEGTCDVSRKLPRNTGSLFQTFLTYSGEAALHTRWRWCCLAVVTAFPCCWSLFAAFYFGATQWHSQANGTLCVENLHSFVAAFLFSVESQERVGYGFRFPNEDCISVIILLPIQTLVGKFIIALVASCVFMRILRPHQRRKALLFSKTAVILTHTRDKNLRCLMFRLGDTDDHQLCSLTYRLYYVDKNQCPENVVAMDVEENGDLFLLPTLVRHEIDHRSPLFKLRRQDLQIDSFELVVVVEGTVETTGLTVQARTSYLPEEIQWGYEFDPLTFIDPNDSQRYIQVNYDYFDATSRVNG